MNIDFKLIKEKYPNGWNKMIRYEVIANKPYHRFCYCDIEKFFDDNDIYIEILFHDWEECAFSYIIYLDTKRQTVLKWEFYFDEDKYYNTRQESKEQAIYKAFEIMEGQIK